MRIVTDELLVGPLSVSSSTAKSRSAVLSLRQIESVNRARRISTVSLAERVSRQIDGLSQAAGVLRLNPGIDLQFGQTADICVVTGLCKCTNNRSFIHEFFAQGTHESSIALGK